MKQDSVMDVSIEVGEVMLQEEKETECRAKHIYSHTIILSLTLDVWCIHSRGTYISGYFR